MTEPIAIIDTGVANVRSMQVAMQRLGFRTELTLERNKIASARRVILPGVGTFQAGMEILEKHELVDVLRIRVRGNQPLLAVCLGLQLLCEGSDENPLATGVGVFGVRVERFPSNVQVPQLGWNRVTPQSGTPFAETFPAGHAYFANSFRVTSQISGFEMATTFYGTEFVSAIYRGQVLACQFHPELSGIWGQQWLQLWLDQTC